MRFDFDHIDMRTGLPRIKERPEDKIHLMSQKPGRSMYIKMLQNRINFNSVGNKRYAEKVYYDRRTSTVTTEDGRTELFRTFKLKSGEPAKGWIEC